MWKLEELIECVEHVKVLVDGKWVAGRPENYKKKYTSFSERLKYAWEVLQGRAEAFTWPEGQ